MENRLALRVVMGAVMFLLNACMQFPTINPDPSKNNSATYKRDLQECQQGYPETSYGAHIPQWIGCMKLKGWQ